MRSLLVLALLATLLGGMAPQVIAADPAPGDPPAALSGESTAPAPVPAEASALAPPIFTFVWAALAIGVIMHRRLARLKHAPDRPMVFDPVLSIGLAAGMFVLGQLGAMVAAQIGGIESGPEEMALGDSAALMGGIYIGQAMVFIAWLGRSRQIGRRGPTSSEEPPANGGSGEDGESAPSRRAPMSLPKAVIAGIVGLAIVWPLASAAGWIALRISVALGAPPPSPIAHSTLAQLMEGASMFTPAWWVVVILVITMAPLMEELLYRGLLQDAVERTGVGRWPAIAGVSVLFALMHAGAVEPHGLAALFVLSLGFGAVYARTGRLTAAVVMHAGFNIGNLLMAWFMTSG